MYVELNIARNDITMWVSDGDYIGVGVNENLESLRRASVPAWVLYQISNI